MQESIMTSDGYSKAIARALRAAKIKAA
jgi:hypothetical protein